MNCQPGSKFIPILEQLARDNFMTFADINRLSNAVTYYSNNGRSCSWIDHVLCTSFVDSIVTTMNVLNEYICSDHRPTSFSLRLTIQRNLDSLNVKLFYRQPS